MPKYLQTFLPVQAAALHETRQVCPPLEQLAEPMHYVDLSRVLDTTGSGNEQALLEYSVLNNLLKVL